MTIGTHVELPKAELEWVCEVYAMCPTCNESHEVSTHACGEIDCECGTKFYWQTDS